MTLEEPHGWTDEWSKEPPDWSYTLARMLLALVPFGGAAQVLVEDTRARAANKASCTLGEIVEETGLERLRERLGENPELDALFAQGIDAAARTGYEAKRRLLGRLISAAVLDDAKVDESLLFVLALKDLDGPHIRALESLRRVSKEIEQSHGGSDQERFHAMRARYPNVPPVVVNSLVREGMLVHTEIRGYEKSHELGVHVLTTFGARLLDHLREVDVVTQEEGEGC